MSVSQAEHPAQTALMKFMELLRQNYPELGSFFFVTGLEDGRVMCVSDAAPVDLILMLENTMELVINSQEEMKKLESNNG